MDWTPRFVGLLEGAFQIEHMTSPDGTSYGAGQPVSSVSVLQSAIPSEEMEHYPEILIDEWAAGHLIDREIGLEMLLEFEFADEEGGAEIVQFPLLQTEQGRAFLGRKLEGQPLEFLLAVDRDAQETLISAFIVALFAADQTFGDPIGMVRLPSSIINKRPDFVREEVIRSGFRLMLDQIEEGGGRSWAAVAERCGVSDSTDHETLIENYFDSFYDESEAY